MAVVKEFAAVEVDPLIRIRKFFHVVAFQRVATKHSALPVLILPLLQQVIQSIVALALIWGKFTPRVGNSFVGLQPVGKKCLL